MGPTKRFSHPRGGTVLWKTPNGDPPQIGELIESGRFSLPVAKTFPLAEIADAHCVSEDGHGRGKVVLLVG
jgi:NADPH:quinone reductase-like Zn-dependent oxidoreductase